MAANLSLLIFLYCLWGRNWFDDHVICSLFVHSFCSDIGAIDRSLPTMIDRSNPDRRWDYAVTWSRGDIEQINRMYECEEYYTNDSKK